MREIKFRAWDYKDKEMSGTATLKELYGAGDGSSASFENLEIMQYTGLKDINDVEIYEGDIIHIGDEEILYEIVWHDTGFMAKQIHCAGSFIGLEYWRENINVIGNIYENKELLDGSKYKPQSEAL